ncbi:gliding motility lipoprotein GldD [Flavobacterium sp.]|jgi:gliding motility-associated lipoprotein GldD|uniref:gliding motility lipoprotein GldD n=1 Tax=Flavobacterium sp. TaxID=239 RepID=UPI0022BF637A|nr:gliding motility lipoprotein GldD [Flavobacterium sp.]MCZ8230104.1 gliding motility lipoprotein GldD [Flavobacterium sp.]
MKRKVSLLIGIVLLAITGCKDDVLPKPSGYLRLDYPEAQYIDFKNACPFTFESNDAAIIEGKSDCSYTITYPKMKATIYLTYKPVSNNIKQLLRDAQKLTFEHVIKADDIIEQPYLNPDKKVYGMFYQVDGNAATNSQFYATDSTRHFITGSVYFYAKPNFDSIMPAASYIKNDMQHLMETLKWK